MKRGLIIWESCGLSSAVWGEVLLNLITSGSSKLDVFWNSADKVRSRAPMCCIKRYAGPELVAHHQQSQKGNSDRDLNISTYKNTLKYHPVLPIPSLHPTILSLLHAYPTQTHTCSFRDEPYLTTSTLVMFNICVIIVLNLNTCRARVEQACKPERWVSIVKLETVKRVKLCRVGGWQDVGGICSISTSFPYHGISNILQRRLLAHCLPREK